MLKKRIVSIDYSTHPGESVNADKASQATNLIGKACYIDEKTCYIPFDYGTYSYGFLGRFETINGEPMYCLLFPKDNFTYID